MSNKQLAATVALCKEWGWGYKPLEELETFDLGSIQQQRIIKQGLSKGEWSRYEYDPVFRTIDYLEGIPAVRMVYLAIRVGVAPKRIVRLLRTTVRSAGYRHIARLVAINGADYAERFIKEAVRFSDTDDFLLGVEEVNVISFYLQTQHFNRSEIIAEENYLKAWSVCVGRALSLPDIRNQYVKDEFPTWKELKPTFAAHLRAAFELGMPMWTALGSVAVEGTYRGLIERNEVLAALLQSLDVVSKPGQRKQLVTLLTAVLRITDEELREHWESFNGVLASAEPSLITAFGLRMIALATDEQLAELVLPLLYVTTLKGLKDVLKAVQARADFSQDTPYVLADRVQELAGHKDPGVASAATTLLSRWGVTPQPAELEQVLIQWEQAPPLWQLPRFHRGPATIDSLTELLSSGAMTERARTLAEEDFYAQLVQLAHTDVAAAKRLLDGLGDQYWWLPTVNESAERGPLQSSHWDQFWDRKNHISYTLGKIPCLLSEPSFVDFSITFADLLQRLEKYHTADLPVMEPDLHLALTRLRIDELDLDSAYEQALRYSMPVQYDVEEFLDRTAGQIIADYIRHPYQKPQLECAVSRSSWSKELAIQPAEIPVPDSLGDIPPRLTLSVEQGKLRAAEAPLWGDVVWTELAYDSRAHADYEGMLALQAAQSEQPLGPGAAVNLIGLCRPSKRNAQERAEEAVRLAWQRGLLKPGVPDPQLLGWKPQGSSFKGIAEVLVDCAQDGMLALSWQLLDDFLVFASQQASTPPGTSEVAEAMEVLAPSVAAALHDHIADETAAKVPGLRLFAAKNNRSKATVAAKAAVQLLPQVESSQATSRINLDQWAKPQPETIDDTATVFVETDARHENRVVVRLEIPDVVSSVYVEDAVIQLWQIPHSLERLTTHHEVSIYTAKGGNYFGHFYMRWEQGQWLVKTNPLAKRPQQQELPMLDSIVQVLLGLIHTEPQAKTARDPFQQYLLEHKISANSVAKTVANLARNPLWSPVKALKLLETDEFLPVLWPLITESLTAGAEYVAAGSSAPRWLSKVLDMGVRHAEVLAAATTEGYIPATAWQALGAIAEQPKKTAASKKAAALQAVVCP